MSANQPPATTGFRPRTFAGYARRQMHWVVYGSLTGVVMNTTVVLPPILLGRAIDAAMALEREGVTPAGLRRLYLAALWYVGVTVVYAIGRLGKRYGFRIMANNFNIDLRSDLLRTTLGWKPARHERERIGDLLSRCIGDIQVVSDTLMTTVTEVFDTGLMMLSNLVALLVYLPGLTLLAAIPVPLTIIFAQATGGAIFARSTKTRVTASRVNSHLQETTVGVRLLRLFGREAAERQRLERLCGDQMKANLDLTVLQGGLMPAYSALATSGVILVIGLGGMRVTHGLWTVGQFTTYLMMFLAFSGRTLVAARVLNRVHAGRAAWTRVAAFLYDNSGAQATDAAATATGTAPTAAPTPAASAAPPVPSALPGHIAARGLTFRFGADGQRPALDRVSFEAPAGSLVAITGPVGSGKTALALALTGLYDYEGSLTVGGREFRALSRAERLATISLLDQDSFLFSATIAENVSFQPLAAGAEPAPALARAATTAALADDLPLFADGYRTMVGELGVRVSGGQRQRIALARSLFPRAPVVVLDDPFSAVDVATERRMLNRLRTDLAGSTVILFSHRLGAFPEADLILLLRDGQVAEAGRHEELLAAGQTYARIFKAQQWLEDNALRGGTDHGRGEGSR
ncbi:MAG: ABC transporter ATP-binding protein [Bacillota bacterium]